MVDLLNQELDTYCNKWILIDNLGIRKLYQKFRTHEKRITIARNRILLTLRKSSKNSNFLPCTSEDAYLSKAIIAPLLEYCTLSLESMTSTRDSQSSLNK